MRLPLLRTLPSKTYRTPSCFATSRTSTERPLNTKLELRAMTLKPATFDNARSECRRRGRRQKYCWSASPLMFSNGSTAIDGISREGCAAAATGFCGADASDRPAPSSVTRYARTGRAMFLRIFRRDRRSQPRSAHARAHEPTRRSGRRRVRRRPPKARRDVDPLSKDILAINQTCRRDGRRCDRRCACSLAFRRCARPSAFGSQRRIPRRRHRRKLQQQPVAHRLDDAAAWLATRGRAASRCSRTARAVPASSSPIRRE